MELTLTDVYKKSTKIEKTYLLYESEVIDNLEILGLVLIYDTETNMCEIVDFTTRKTLFNVDLDDFLDDFIYDINLDKKILKSALNEPVKLDQISPDYPDLYLN